MAPDTAADFTLNRQLCDDDGYVSDTRVAGSPNVFDPELTYLRQLQYAGWCERQHVTMLSVGPLELQLYIEHLRGRGLAEATISRRYGTVSSLLRYAYRLEVIPKNPADFVDRPTVNRDLQKTPRMSPLELADVIRQAKRHARPVATRDRNLAVVLLMGVMGLRVAIPAGRCRRDLPLPCRGQRRSRRLPE